MTVWSRRIRGKSRRQEGGNPGFSSGPVTIAGSDPSARGHKNTTEGRAASTQAASIETVEGPTRSDRVRARHERSALAGSGAGRCGFWRCRSRFRRAGPHRAAAAPAPGEGLTLRVSTNSKGAPPGAARGPGAAQGLAVGRHLALSSTPRAPLAPEQPGGPAGATSAPGGWRTNKGPRRREQGRPQPSNASRAQYGVEAVRAADFGRRHGPRPDSRIRRRGLAMHGVSSRARSEAVARAPLWLSERSVNVLAKDG